MYYIEDDDKIILYDEDINKLQETLVFMPQYSELEIQETDRPIVDFEFADTPEYIAKELEQAKEDKIKENDTVRDETLNSGVEYEDVLFDSDTDQKVNLLATVSAMDDEDVITWFGMDNQPLECHKSDLIAIGGLITQLHSFCWNKNAQIKAEIDMATTKEEVDAIEIDYKQNEVEE